VDINITVNVTADNEPADIQLSDSRPELKSDNLRALFAAAQLGDTGDDVGKVPMKGGLLAAFIVAAFRPDDLAGITGSLKDKFKVKDNDGNFANGVDLIAQFLNENNQHVATLQAMSKVYLDLLKWSAQPKINVWGDTCRMKLTQAARIGVSCWRDKEALQWWPSTDCQLG
jgi:hypothetical protein